MWPIYPRTVSPWNGLSKAGPSSNALQLPPTLPPSPAPGGESHRLNHTSVIAVNYGLQVMLILVWMGFFSFSPESGASDGDLQLRDSVPVRSKRGNRRARLGPVSCTSVTPAQARALPHMQPGWTAPPHGGDAKETRPVKRLECKTKHYNLGVGVNWATGAGQATAHYSEHMYIYIWLNIHQKLMCLIFKFMLSAML